MERLIELNSIVLFFSVTSYPGTLENSASFCQRQRGYTLFQVFQRFRFSSIHHCFRLHRNSPLSPSDTMFLTVFLQEEKDIKFKFARTRVWMYYVSEISALPPPFNLFPVEKVAMGARWFAGRCKWIGRVSVREREPVKNSWGHLPAFCTGMLRPQV